MTRPNIAIFSDDLTVREALRKALGRRLSQNSPEHTIFEFATADALRLHVDGAKPGSEKGIDLFILDGEATPEGGMGVARQLKDEVFDCAPILLVVAREQDAWLAGWSRADAIIAHPIDPFVLAARAEALLQSSTLPR